ncbi:hypothetical protein B0H17DRAFT_1142304 [Mycena rosella]|uniref:Uncharacterized protein n=1 Tax=Mycena rosella TaxID=1033263 RepID=A0AAD7G9G8_MYCRO|nr:hypothetical protein B0H17DRAFT_1142304 [Mycena rosella]
MDYVVDPAEFDPLWTIMLDIVCLACVSHVSLAYGVIPPPAPFISRPAGLYVVLFIFAIRILIRRDSPGRRVLLGTTSVMFLLGTCGTLVVVVMAGVAIRINKTVVQGSADLPRLAQLLNVLQLTEVVRVTTNNESFQLYRCYIIWGSNKKVLVLPAICILATVVLMIVSWLAPLDEAPYIDSRAPFIATLGTNVLLMLLTAGRIWYIARRVRIIHEDHPASRSQYNMAIALILESGAMYCFCLILWVISLTTAVSPTGESNIAPTLILVRVGRGHWQGTHDIKSPATDPSDGNIRFRVPSKPVDTSYPVIEIK